MESLLGSLVPEPLDKSQLPSPRLSSCQECHDPMNVWEWGPQPIPPTATVITEPPAFCFTCLEKYVRLQKPTHKQYVLFRWNQWRHHQMWYRVGEPPGTLVAWQVGLNDQNGRLNPDGSPISYPAYIYGVRVDWWNDNWPQQTYSWTAEPDGPCLVVLGAHVYAASHSKACWRFRWWWHNPTWPEACSLEPPHVDLTDQEIVQLNRARRAFYEFAGRRGLKTGDILAGPRDRNTWHREGARIRKEIIDRGHKIDDVTLAQEMGISPATFGRRKSAWGAPGLLPEDNS